MITIVKRVHDITKIPLLTLEREWDKIATEAVKKNGGNRDVVAYVKASRVFLKSHGGASKAGRLSDDPRN